MFDEKFLSRMINIPISITPKWVSATFVGMLIVRAFEKNKKLKERLGELEGKYFLFETTDSNQTLAMHIQNRKIRMLPHFDGTPNVVMRGETITLLKLLLGKTDPDTVFFGRKLEITGDTDIALNFKNILNDL